MEATIDKLHPAIKDITKDFIQAAHAHGIELKITFSMRTFAEQQALYDQGRTKPGNIVTKAKPGQSFHNYGLAIDVVPMVDGKPDWESKLWDKIGQIGTACGFEWGGSWKTILDRPHFQYPKNTNYKVLLALKNAGKVDKDGFVILP